MEREGGGGAEGREREKVNHHSARHMDSHGGRVIGAISGNPKVRR